jgi:hypothetical protein
VALLEKRRFLYNHSGDFPQVILIVPSHVPNNTYHHFRFKGENFSAVAFTQYHDVYYNTGEKAEEYDRGRGNRSKKQVTC